jgi:sortase family protein
VTGGATGSRLLQRAGWVPFACAILTVAVLALAGITWQNSPYWGRNPQAAPRDIGSVPTASPPAPARLAAAVQIAPNRIVIPKLKTSAKIVKVATTPDGELEIPLDPKVVGWWRYGAKPGAAKGTAILAGHINYAGVTGSMAQIGKLAPGDQVDVFGTQNANDRAEVRFRVTGVRTYHKTNLPYRQIFDQAGVGRIAIVTCGGPFDTATGNYLDNIVVFAVPE